MQDSKRNEFRSMLEADGTVLTPVVHDALSARIVDEMERFDLMGVSGYGVSLSNLGLPDAGYLTMSEVVDTARNISGATDIPVFADADTGFGNAINARRTIRELIQTTEVAGALIEDQVDPKRCGSVAGRKVLPMEEAVGKYEAVSDVRDEYDDDFMIIARTDAMGAVHGSLDDAIRRGRAYYEAGADVLFVEGPTEYEEVAKVGDELSDVPLFYVQGWGSPYINREELSELGFDISAVVASLQPAIVGMHDHLAAISSEGIEAEVEFQAEIENHPMGDLHEFAGFESIRELEERYLPAEEQEKYEQSSGHAPGAEED